MFIQTANDSAKRGLETTSNSPKHARRDVAVAQLPARPVVNDFAMLADSVR